jgi:hypothetical protein
MGTLKKVCEMCDTNRSSMLKCSGCNCTYYCSKECQKKGWNPQIRVKKFEN